MKLAVLADLREERWPSMDLVAEELVRHARTIPGWDVRRLRPELPAAVGRALPEAPPTRGGRWFRRGGLIALRFGVYPLYLRRHRQAFDWFHVADHSYAHLTLTLPAGKSGAYCHDIDAFRPLSDRHAPPWLKLWARRALAGLRAARVVFHSTPAVRAEILEHGWVPEARLVHAPYGVSSEFSAEPTPEDARLAVPAPYLLHVGSLIARKNPDFLLELAGAMRRAHPGLVLVQIGGEFGPADRARLEREGLAGAVLQRRGLTRGELAAYYRNAAAVVLPSLREGFGLPVIEALSCGASVVASDLPVLREVGKDAALYAPPGDRAAWLEALDRVLSGRGPGRERRLIVASDYSWQKHAETIVGAYASLAPR